MYIYIEREREITYPFLWYKLVGIIHMYMHACVSVGV